jgi:hypothetical protein
MGSIKIVFVVVLYIFRSFWDMQIMRKIEENRTRYVLEGPVSGYRGFYGALYQDLC